MKKLICAMLAGLVVCQLAACGGASTSSTSETTQASANADNSTKKYIISTDTMFAPFEFTDSDGKFKGIDVDIMEAIAEDQGFEYEMNSLGFDAALAAVQAGQADGVIAGMSITDERKKTFDFSEPYYQADVTLAVAKGTEISSLDDLKGKKIAVKTGTNGADYAKSIKDQYGFEIVEFKDSPTMYQDVIAGNTFGCYEDYPVMAYNIQKGAQLEIPDGFTANGTPLGFAVMKGKNSELREMFDAGLKNIQENGKFQEIVDKYTK